MFKNLVRSEKYLITAVLYLPKNMDTKMVSFLSSGAGTAMLDDLDKRGYRVFCVSLNFELNAELTNTYSCKPANSLLELMKRDLRLISEPHIYIAGYCDRNASEWQMVKNSTTGLPLVSLVDHPTDARTKEAFLYRLNENGEACMVFDSAYFGSANTPITAQSYTKWECAGDTICPLIDVNVKNGGKEMQAAMFQLPTPEIPAPFCRLYDEQGSDEEDWFAAASFSPRSDNDGSKHPVFVDDGFGKPVPASDVIQNRDGEFSSRCSTSKELFDFNVKVAQNR